MIYQAYEDSNMEAYLLDNLPDEKEKKNIENQYIFFQKESVVSNWNIVGNIRQSTYYKLAYRVEPWMIIAVSSVLLVSVIISNISSQAVSRPLKKLVKAMEEALELLEEMKIEIIALVSPEALFKSIYKLMGYERDRQQLYILKVKEFIDKNYMEAIKIKDLSDYIHVTPNYLGKLFYLNTGEYLRDYINSVKLEKSRELLLSKKYQVSEVAVMVGIEDQRYFSKLFKKYFGVSPKDYGR